MPFTLAHPAAVLPLIRTRLVFSALVAGSLAPDMEYFVRLSTVRPVGHTMPGLIWLTVPMGLTAFALWHVVLKRPLVDLLPESHRRKLLPLCAPLPPMRPLLALNIVFAVFLGALTHVFWDSFTHAGGYFPQNYPVFNEVVLRAPYLSFQLRRVLQHGSTLFGFAALALAYAWWYVRASEDGNAPPSPFSVQARISIIAGLLLIAGVVAVLYAWPLYHPLASPRSFRFFTAKSVLAGMDALVIGMIAFGLWWRVWRLAARARYS